MTPTPAGDSSRGLIDRIRALLPGQHLQEVRMFGVLALMVDGAMAVAAHNDGSLLVRVDPAEDAILLAKPHASRAEMGTGRSMGQGWIRVEASGLRKDQALADWLEAATRNLTHRKPGRSRAR
ncbi:TfoX/Sxy family transcriptional regulator of competence genes [Nakamurella sp. UYEF19]|uniref:TfoX/Sxy family protein n=1 Tax=Nakamurella sp. UYEF19 TaxID=1756392 RepID=UPI0033938578